MLLVWNIREIINLLERQRGGFIKKKKTKKTGKNYLKKNSFESNNKGNDDIKAVLSLIEYNGGGGKIKAGGLLNMEEGQGVEAVAHELFHGYQSEKGEQGVTINREVGAYLFGKAVANY